VFYSNLEAYKLDNKIGYVETGISIEETDV